MAQIIKNLFAITPHNIIWQLRTDRGATTVTSHIASSFFEQAKVHLAKAEFLEAHKIYSEILSTNPCDITALLGVGIVAQKLKSYDLALSFFSKVIAVNGHCMEAFLQRGKTHALAKNFEQAVADFTTVLVNNPTNIEALNSRGVANSQLLNFSCAVQDFDRAIQVCSTNADLFYNRGLAQEKLGNYDAAIKDYTSAIELRSNFYQAFNNRGAVRKELSDFAGALLDFEKSTKLNSDFADGYWNQSLIHLMNGEYDKAWPLYEYRWKSKHFPSQKRNFTEPVWLGERSIDGKTILIHSEQGLGDTIQFCRYLKMLRNYDCEVFLEVEEPLKNLMSCLLPQENIFVKGDELPKFDFHCPLISLPFVFNTNVNSVPFSTPYLTTDRDRVSLWAEFLGSTEKPRVGLCWRGNPNHPNDKRRSIFLRDIIDTLQPEFDWLSLQYDITEEEAKIMDSSQSIRHFGKLIGDFSETAAFCKNLDAIICVDTSIAHLAGSLGSKVFLLLAKVADSRWHAKGSTTPWYENVTILRKNSKADYPELLHKAQILIGQIHKSETA